MSKCDRDNRESGFSLIELLIVSVILLMILGIMAGIVSGVQSSYRTYRQRSAKHNDALAALNIITRTIRNAGNNTASGALIPTGSNRLQVRSDWTEADGALDDPFENVEFYVQDDILFIADKGPAPNVSELSAEIQSVAFEYFDSGGSIASVPADAAMVKVTVNIVDEPVPLVAAVGVRGKIQPK
jgi:prepilin-type N-terminal cleavage/methylation domain-containing protein